MEYLVDVHSLNNKILVLSYNTGRILHIRLTGNSGRIVTRKKVNTISNVDHPGIYIGIDAYTNEDYIIHNHYRLFDTVGISPISEYGSGVAVFWDYRFCQNTRLQILEQGLKQAIEREPYNWLVYNCQTTVNQACNNVRKSEDVEKWSGIAALGLLGVLFAKVIAS